VFEGKIYIFCPNATRRDYREYSDRTSVDQPADAIAPKSPEFGRSSGRAGILFKASIHSIAIFGHLIDPVGRLPLNFTAPKTRRDWELTVPRTRAPVARRSEDRQPQTWQQNVRSHRQFRGVEDKFARRSSATRINSWSVNSGFVPLLRTRAIQFPRSIGLRVSFTRSKTFCLILNRAICQKTNSTRVAMRERQDFFSLACSILLSVGNQTLDRPQSGPETKSVP
jgi:hypothetical protein